MKLTENNDPKVHLTEVKQHFQLMGQRHDNILKMGSLALQHNHHVLAPGVIPTNPPDDNSCGVSKHPAWHIVIKGNEA